MTEYADTIAKWATLLLFAYGVMILVFNGIANADVAAMVTGAVVTLPYLAYRRNDPATSIIPRRNA